MFREICVALLRIKSVLLVVALAMPGQIHQARGSVTSVEAASAAAFPSPAEDGLTQILSQFENSQMWRDLQSALQTLPSFLDDHAVRSTTSGLFSFTQFGLQEAPVKNPTSLEFGPDGRLYVAQQDGIIHLFRIVRVAPGEYQVVGAETIDTIVENTPNHDDDGAANPSKARQVTGLMTAGTYDNSVLYVSSSDWRIAVGKDANLDTNSGVVTRLTWVGDGVDDSAGYWDRVDIVRGLPRSEENHSTNGMDLDPATNTLYVASGGHTNKGAPSGSMAGTPEYYLSAALLVVDLDAIDAMPVYTDPRSGIKFIYDLPTLDDPTRPNIDNTDSRFPYPASHPFYTHEIDLSDPFGGNDGLNQAIPEPDGPVQLYATGLRNAYDVVVTQSGQIYTVDNGANTNWGGTPPIYDSENRRRPTGSYDPDAGDVCHNELNEDDAEGRDDDLQLIDGPGYYGGHATPIRAFPAESGIYQYEKTENEWVQIGDRYGFEALLPANLSLDDFENAPDECRYQDGANVLARINASTNGITEYTASNFGSTLKGGILTASFNGLIYLYLLNDSGDRADQEIALFSNFGSIPLDVTTQDDGELFAGTVWAATYGSSDIVVFEPLDGLTCSGQDDEQLDEDGDGYSNHDEIHGDSDPCSPANRPIDHDLDYISDLRDSDDDNDGIADIDDPFALDKNNGLTTYLPVLYPFFNDNPGTGLFGLGITGLMANGTQDYLSLYDDADLAAGGTAGLLTVEQVDDGSAIGPGNDQRSGFQFGVNVGVNSSPFEVHTRLVPPFFASGGPYPTDARLIGLQIGAGNQDSYLMIALVENGGQGGVEVLLEVNGAIVDKTLYGPEVVGDVLNATSIDLFLMVEPGTGRVLPQVGIAQNNSITLGNRLGLPNGWFDPVDRQGLAVGIVATAGATGSPFAATWDFLNVDYVASDAAALVQVHSGIDSINASTYEDNSFRITNNSLGSQKITRVRYDLSTSILPEMVFDPNGTAGDVVAKPLTVNADDGVTLLDSSLTVPHGNGGFHALELVFGDFDPGDTFGFSIDVDPTSIEGLSAPGPGDSGSVAGLELVGSRITVTFDDEFTLTNHLFGDGSKAGSETVVETPASTAPVLALEGFGVQPVTVEDADQTLRIDGPPNADVKLLLMESAFWEDEPGSLSQAPFEANSAISVVLQDVTLDETGTTTASITLESSNTAGGYNYIVGAVDDGDLIGQTSNVLVARFASRTPSVDPPPQTPTLGPSDSLYINAGGPGLTLGSTNWLVDTAFVGGNEFSTDDPIDRTDGDLLYQTERYGRFSYVIDVEEISCFAVTLHLAEIYWTQQGLRTFDVNIEGTKVLDDYDIFLAAGGHDFAHKERFVTAVDDGQLDIVFTGGLDNAKLSALQIVPDDSCKLEPTVTPTPTPTPDPTRATRFYFPHIGND